MTRGVSPQPLVSVIIPAFKPQHLVDAITSAREQTCADIEILVGDDTPDGGLETIVTSVDDPRVSYHYHGFGDAELNLRRLWERSTGRYVKVLFDDDVLLPDSQTWRATSAWPNRRRSSASAGSSAPSASTPRRARTAPPRGSPPAFTSGS